MVFHSINAFFAGDLQVLELLGEQLILLQGYELVDLKLTILHLTVSFRVSLVCPLPTLYL